MTQNAANRIIRNWNREIDAEAARPELHGKGPWRAIVWGGLWLLWLALLFGGIEMLGRW